jgi:hypothetical protein
VRQGYEHFKTGVEEGLIKKTLAEFQEQHTAILGRKIETLLQECQDYLALALKSSEMLESECEALKSQAIGEREVLDDVMSEIRLLIRHMSGNTRSRLENRLSGYQSGMEAELLRALKFDFTARTKSLSDTVAAFEKWLGNVLAEELRAISAQNRAPFVAPLDKLKKQVFRALQGYRDRLSERTVRAFGVPLRTTEPEIHIEEPRSPDIHIGRIFDRQWELLSPMAPMWLVKPILKRHFARLIPFMVEKNLSRLAWQWEETIHAAMKQVDAEAERRLDDLIKTVERLLTSSSSDAPQIRADSNHLCSLREEMIEAARATESHR